MFEEIFNRVNQNEFEEIYEFHERYSRGKRSRYVWEWEYGRLNPNPSVLIGVKVDERFIATQGMYTIKLNVNDKIELTGKNESLLIDQDYRGTGLSKRLYDYAISEYSVENITCLWGFSRKAIGPLKRAEFRIYKDSVKRAFLSLNYMHAYKLSTKSVNTFSGRFKNAIKVFIGTSYSGVKFSLYKRPEKELKSEIAFFTELQKPDDLINLYKKIRSKIPDLIHIHQDFNYFNWRIKNSPLRIHTLFVYECNELIGYLYLTFRPNFCEITDLLFINDDTGKLLINKLVDIIHKEDIKFLYYTFNTMNILNKVVLNQLKKIGFIVTLGPNHFVLRNFKHDSSESFFNIERWYINNLWSEGI